MKFDRRKIFIAGSTSVIKMTGEVKNALRRKDPSDTTLIKLLVSNDLDDVTTNDAAIRQLAYNELFRRGYSVEK